MTASPLSSSSMPRPCPNAYGEQWCAGAAESSSGQEAQSESPYAGAKSPPLTCRDPLATLFFPLRGFSTFFPRRLHLRQLRDFLPDRCSTNAKPTGGPPAGQQRPSREKPFRRGCGGSNAPNDLVPARRHTEVPQATLAAIDTTSSIQLVTCIIALAAAHTRRSPFAKSGPRPRHLISNALRPLVFFVVEMSCGDGDAPSAMFDIAAPHATVPSGQVLERALHRVHRPPRQPNTREDDDIKSVTGGLSPSVHSSLWDGTIQLNASVKVFMSAFFKSGEKIVDIVWPDTIEIKGRVKLEDFQNFVKDLRHSRNRSIMVTSLCWNVQSSEDGLQGIEVAKRFEVSQRVGFAEIKKGPYIYVCPRSEAIITVLDKYGFWKGVSTVDKDQNSLIGFVVWDRSPLINTSTTRSSIKKVQEIQGTQVEAQDVTDVKVQHEKGSCPIKMDDILHIHLDFPSRYVHADKTGKAVYHPEAAIPDSESKLASKLLMQSSQVTSFRVPSLIASQKVLELPSHDIPNPPLETPYTRQHVLPIMDSHGGSLQMEEPSSHFHVVQKFTSTFEAYKTGVHGLPLQPLDAYPDLATEKNHINGALSGSITQQKYISSDESPQLQQNPSLFLYLNSSHTPDDEDDLPEFVFSPACGAEVKHNVHPLNKETEVSRKITNPISHYNMERECFRENNGFDDGDRMMWHFSELDHEKLLKDGSTGLNPRGDKNLLFHHSPDVETVQGLFLCHPPLAPADQGLFHGHRPPPLSDQGLYPLYPPRVPADQRLVRQHPPMVLAEQGSYPPHPPPGLPDQGLYPRRPPPVPADQGFFHWHHPRVLGDQGFTYHRPPSSAPGYFGSSEYHGNNNGHFPGQQHLMFGQRPQTSYASSSSQHMRPPRGFAPGHAWRPMLHPRLGNNHHGFERSDGFSGSSTGYYSGPGDGSGSRPSSYWGH